MSKTEQNLIAASAVLGGMLEQARKSRCATDEISDGFHTFGELYEHRRALFIALVKLLPVDSWIAHLHHDGTRIEGWFLAGIDLPGGETITYHLPDSDWDIIRDTGCTEYDVAPEWDGHIAADVVERLREWVETR